MYELAPTTGLGFGKGGPGPGRVIFSQTRWRF